MPPGHKGEKGRGIGRGRGGEERRVREKVLMQSRRTKRISRYLDYIGKG